MSKVPIWDISKKFVQNGGCIKESLVDNRSQQKMHVIGLNYFKDTISDNPEA